MKKYRLIYDRKEFPKCVQHFKQLKGISVGGCIDPEYEIEKPNAAHAHSYHGDLYRGWICLGKFQQLREKFTLLHEVAHLLVNKTRKIPMHGKEWRKVVKDIGGSYKPYTYIYGNLMLTYRNFSHSDPSKPGSR